MQQVRATIDDLYAVPGKAELVGGQIVHMAPAGDAPNRSLRHWLVLTRRRARLQVPTAPGDWAANLGESPFGAARDSHFRPSTRQCRELVAATAVRWYCRFRQSAAHVRDVLAERGVDVSDRTVLAWVHRFGPLLAAEGRRHARRVGIRW